MKRYKLGFTVLELLIVCAIITALTSIVVIEFNRSKMRTRDAQRKADLTKMAGALESYKTDIKVYLSSGAGTPPPAQNVNTALSTLDDSPGFYINSLPIDPSGQNYTYVSDTYQYKLFAKSETITSATDTAAQSKAGDFYNPTQPKCFQISSSSTALSTYTDSNCN